jgi:hypothetical protein
MVKSRRTRRAVTEVVRNPVSVDNGVVADQAAGDLAMGGAGKSFVESAQGEDEAIAPRRREGGGLGLGLWPVRARQRRTAAATARISNRRTRGSWRQYRRARIAHFWVQSASG